MFDIIPLELVSHVASFLSCKSDIASFAATCKLAHTTAQPHLWKTINLSRRDYSASDLDQLGSNVLLSASIIPHIRNLSISLRFAASFDTHIALNNLVTLASPYLESLHLANVTIHPNTVRALASASRLENLSLVEVSYTSFRNNEHTDSPAASPFSNTTSLLSLEHSPKQSAAYAVKSLTAVSSNQDTVNYLLHHFPSLEHLVIRGKNMQYSHDTFSPHLWPNLRLLALDLSDSLSLEYMLSLLRDINTSMQNGTVHLLETLILEAHCLETSSFETVLRLIAPFTSLKKLAILFARDTDPTFIHQIAQALPQLNTLQIGRQSDYTKLGLEEWPGATAAYGFALRSFRNLEHFAWNKIAREDEDIEDMAVDEEHALQQQAIGVRRASEPEVVYMRESDSMQDSDVEMDSENENENVERSGITDPYEQVSGYEDQRRDAQVLFTACPTLKSCSVLDRMLTLNYSGPTFYRKRTYPTRDRRTSTSLLTNTGMSSAQQQPSSSLQIPRTTYTSEGNRDNILRALTSSRFSSSIVYPPVQCA